MPTSAFPSDKAPIIEQIDKIIRELGTLRSLLIKPSVNTTQNLTDELFGVLGHGSWDEYDPDLDWLRFSQ